MIAAETRSRSAVGATAAHASHSARGKLTFANTVVAHALADPAPPPWSHATARLTSPPPPCAGSPPATSTRRRMPTYDHMRVVVVDPTPIVVVAPLRRWSGTSSRPFTQQVARIVAGSADVAASAAKVRTHATNETQNAESMISARWRSPAAAPTRPSARSGRECSQKRRQVYLIARAPKPRVGASSPCSVRAEPRFGASSPRFVRARRAVRRFFAALRSGAPSRVGASQHSDRARRAACRGAYPFACQFAARCSHVRGPRRARSSLVTRCSSSLIARCLITRLARSHRRPPRVDDRPASARPWCRADALAS